MSRHIRIAVVIAVVAAVAVGSLAVAAKPTKPKPTCPLDIYCLDVWDPVLCADGLVYSNMCYAMRDCAPMPCVSLYDTPVLAQ